MMIVGQRIEAAPLHDAHGTSTQPASGWRLVVEDRNGASLDAGTRSCRLENVGVILHHHARAWGSMVGA
jgi:hypothetical protein